MKELKKAVNKLKKKKAPGPDNITNEMLQHLGNTALQKLLDIYNLSWKKRRAASNLERSQYDPNLEKRKK